MNQYEVLQGIINKKVFEFSTEDLWVTASVHKNFNKFSIDLKQHIDTFYTYIFLPHNFVFKTIITSITSACKMIYTKNEAFDKL